MRKLMLAVTTVFLAATLLSGGVVAYAQHSAVSAETVKKQSVPDRQKMAEQWQRLTDEQKAEIYALRAAVDESRAAMIRKAESYGVLDKETADTIIKAMLERTAKLKASGEMPLLGGGLPYGGKKVPGKSSERNR